MTTIIARLGRSTERPQVVENLGAEPHRTFQRANETVTQAFGSIAHPPRSIWGRSTSGERRSTLIQEGLA
jgi:hypothetical protein